MSPPALETKAAFALRSHNPDVLNCIANLSNDEVFTPPGIANRMLDALEVAWTEAHGGATIWADSSVTFLDPFTKSGVFLREIVSRLNIGLAMQIPDPVKRVDHILTKQIFGIGITRLTSLLARRSVYCSKDAVGEHSIATGFDRDWGNIWFEPTQHTWIGGTRELRVDSASNSEVAQYSNRRCQFCGASEGEYSRDASAESHAYAFIHTSDIKARVNELFGASMQFDVVIGNPPYQLGSDGGTRDVPIYQRFVEQAKKLEPRFISMIIPSRWMAAGLGLNEFRSTMLSDERIASLTDFPSAKDVFAGVEIKGGVCYFLWDSEHSGESDVTTVRAGESVGPVKRDLSEYDVFVRDHSAVSILKKVRSAGERSVNAILSADKEFGWTSNFDGFHDHLEPGDVPLHFVRNSKRAVGFIPRSEVTKSQEFIDTWKVLVPKAGSGADAVPDYVLSTPLIAASPSVCTQTFLFFHVASEIEAQSILSYLSTRFFRFLVSLRKITQDATKSTYVWVPEQSWDRVWTDEDLYAKYGIAVDEQTYIESRIKAVTWAPDGAA